MKSEAAVIIGVIMALASLANIVITPEDAEAIQLLVEAFILAGGTALIRRKVYSEKTVQRIKRASSEGVEVR